MFNFDRLMSLAKSQKRSASYLCSLIPRANNYINDLRRHNRTPSADIVAIWATALNTTPAYLMGETDDSEIKKELTTNSGDELDKQFIAFYGDVKPYLDDDDLNDIKIFMQMKADYKKRKMMDDDKS